MSRACEGGERLVSGSPTDAEATRAWSERDVFLEECRARLRVALQPLYALGSGALYGFEALTRGWERMGCDTAHALFDRAATLDALAELEAMQTRRAVNLLADWSGAGAPVLFVNLDSRILARPNVILDEVAAALSARSFGRRRLCFELSERHDKTQIDDIDQNIEKIRSAGFQIAIDDFGAGVSDIKALYKYNLDFLKIDRFFIDGVSADQRKRLFVKNIVELAHVLGQRVIAEGVERLEDLVVCRDLGCDIAQGFHLQKPLESLGEARTNLAFDRSDLEETVEASLRDHMVELPWIHHATPMRDVVRRFASFDAPQFFPVLNDLSEPIGIVRESALRELIYSRVGLDLLQNANSGIRLSQFLSSCPTVDEDTDIDRLTERFAEDGVEGVIVTSHMRYAGFVPTARLLLLSHERGLRAARGQNPLTQLDGNGVITSFIEDSAKRTESDRFFAYFDFDNFKPFNDVYGFSLGDRAILLFARLMRKTFEGDAFLLGHIGGDDFFVGAESVDPLVFTALARELLARFRHEAESLYTAEDRQAGCITTPDREGRLRRFPLLSCSVGVLHAQEGVGFAVDAVGAAAAAAKKRAKAQQDHFARLALGASEADAA